MINEVVKEAEQLSIEIMDSLKLPKKRLKPLVLMLGGFQGSGKTTVASELKNDLELVLLSMDEIRQRLFDKKYPFSEKFRQIVEVTSNKVFKNLLQAGYSVVLDVMATPARIETVKKLLEREKFNNYSLLTVYLEVSKQELIRRLNTREYAPGRYRGTVDELEASMKQHGEIDKSIYNVIIDTEKLDSREVAEVIINKVKEF